MLDTGNDEEGIRVFLSIDVLKKNDIYPFMENKI